ncbi:hypothetical protein RSOLAG1IB_06023 [Rhizoctonia solani AG-1 IB]|uniref:Transmembrane protein n=2 Tax=Rhizoctonia solani TaxID=456999 RepID=M5CA54_THACB|nr:unnamed protein product [Rhizoctonia solani]CCO35955.1 hypothetical protein BN14_10077 [Rhizoctonia solani AG-1 IB]CEL52955.1 hypothetical protein RSOLAG1IB_06023 [Rhizoctonia solani AG-1 IB]
MSTTRQRQTGKTEAETHPDNLPSKRQGQATQDVRPPLSGTSLSTVIYVLAGLGLIWGALSAYRVAQLKADAGGWYNLALGRRPDTGAPMKGNPHVGSHKASTHNTGAKGVENRIRALADELGIHPRELASAIRPLMPTASASSISAEASATPMADAVIGVLGSEDPSGEQQGNAASGFPDLGTLVGLDDPAPGLDG